MTISKRWPPTAVLVLLATACQDGQLMPIADLGARSQDAGGIMLDAGSASDGGAAPIDKGVLDAGVPPVDMGKAQDLGMDAGALPVDMGEAPVPGCSTNVAAQLNNVGVPGLSAGVIKNGRLVCTTVGGQAHIEEGRPVRPDTVFAWASVSKTVTGVAVMLLHQDGAIDLDDDINDHLPFSLRNPHCSGDAITFRQILTHSSSLIDGDAYDELYTIGDSPISLSEFVQAYFLPDGDYYDEDNFDTDCPGEYNEYSNTAFGLLGFLVERVSGMTFDQFCQQRIFGPLGMDQTSFHLANLDPSQVAMPYEGGPGNFSAHGHVGFPTYPDGLLRTSVPNLAKFLAMFANGGIYNGQRILSQASVDEMMRLQTPDLDDTQGLAWYYDDFGDRTDIVGHNGGDPGTSSQMFFDPADGAGVLIVANGDWYNRNGDSPEADAILEALFEESEDH